MALGLIGQLERWQEMERGGGVAGWTCTAARAKPSVHVAWDGNNWIIIVVEGGVVGGGGGGGGGGRGDDRSDSNCSADKTLCTCVMWCNNWATGVPRYITLDQNLNLFLRLSSRFGA